MAELQAFGGAAFEPKLGDVTLELRGRSLKPEHVTSPWLPEYRAGEHLLVLSNAAVVNLNPETRKPRWSADSPDGMQLGWLAANRDVAWLQGFREEASRLRSEPDTKLRGLDVKSGKWLPPMRIPGAEKGEVVVAALATNESLVALSTILENIDQWSQRMTSYRVTYFALPAGEKVWSQSFRAAEQAERPSATLWAPRMPNQAQPSVRLLSWLNGDLLACAGARQDLHCLERKSGRRLWSVERVWEFERGFIGPSVWSHFISRHGVDGIPWEKSNVDAEASKQFDGRWKCSIVGGPVVAPRTPAERGEPAGTSIFVAVAKGPAEGPRGTWGSYLSDCVVYELNGEGQPVSMANLPRMVNGWQVRADADGVIWGCQNNAMIRLHASDHGWQIGGGPGGPDMLAKVDWYRELSAADPKAWLVADKSGDPLAYGRSRAFRVVAGGYVQQRSERLYHFPLSAIDYATGLAEPLTLHVPLTDTVPPPETNVSSVNGHLRAIGPYLLAITALNADHDSLAITLGMEKWSGTAIFNLTAFK
jgi:hypothetical protein